MSEELSLEELARRTGEPAERLRQWQSLGLIGSPDADGFRPEEVEYVRMLQRFLRRGINLETIVEAVRSGRLRPERHLEVMFPHGAGRMYSLAEAAEMAGVDLAQARRLWEATLSETGEELSQDDLQALRSLKTALEAGFPEEAIMQVTRVFADALARVAEAEIRLFHFYVHERFKEEGLSGEALAQASDQAGELARPLIDPIVLYFHRKGFERAVRDDAVMHMAEEAGLLPSSEVPGQMQMAVAFVDLASFTPLTEAMGDAEAARVLERFSSLVRESAARWDGRVVKQIGDAFMLAFPEPRSAVACALEIEARTAAEPQFPAARSGVHWGQVLYREGDYVGSSVNLAARLAAEAQRHQVLVTSAVRKEAKGLVEVEFVRLGKRRLKGMSEEVEVFEARSAASEGREKVTDPVCGMELGPAEIAARLSLEGTEREFCSEECLRRFVAAPERYES